jgi:hypothetical protein
MSSAAGADLMQELLQHRLTKTIPWFLTLMGAYQDAQVVGLVCSYQHWVFDKRKGKDEPAIALRPIENIRFDPGADWMDPVNTSPYLIDMIPMYVKDVRARMKNDPKTGEKKWKTVEEAVLLQAVRGYSDSTRLTREQGRTDSKEQVNSVRPTTSCGCTRTSSSTRASTTATTRWAICRCCPTPSRSRTCTTTASART